MALFPAPAGATVVHRLALDQLHRQASAVVSGEVVASRTRVLPGSKLIVTNHVISVRRCFKRGPCPQAVTVQTLGGEVGDRGMLVEGMPRLARGQQVVVFGRRSGAVLLPVGLAQGVFHISGHWAVRDLRGLDLLVNAKRVRGEVQRHDLRALEAALERLAAQ